MTSNEVSKDVFHNEKAQVDDSVICTYIREFKLASELVKSASMDLVKKGFIAKDETLQCIDSNLCNPDQDTKAIPLHEEVRQLQSEVLALKTKRADEGRANEKVVSIYTSREQAWKAEKRRFLSEQKRLWQELQRAFMEQEVLKQRTLQLSGAQGGDLVFTCEDCEQREGWLNEMKDRLREQEFVIMTSMEEAKAEQQEKNSIAIKLAKLEADYCEVNEKLRLESEARIQSGQNHTVALAELENKCTKLEAEKSLSLHDLEQSQKALAEACQEKKHYEDLVAEMSTEIHILHVSAHEKEDIITAMLKKADGDAEERQQLEIELAIIKAKSTHSENEKEKQRKCANGNGTGIDNELMKPRRSLGSKVDSGYESLRELQRLHDNEIRDLQSAFEEEVRILKKRLSFFQDRVADLEENILLRLAKNARLANACKKKCFASPVEVTDGLLVYKSYMDEDMSPEQFQLSVAKSLLRQYMDTDAQREQEIQTLKKAYFTSKSTIELLHKEKINAASCPRTRGLGDWFEVEKTRSKLEQRHMQEISAFERQLQARDERMEAFRQQLLSMEREAEQKKAKIEALSRELKEALEENALLKKQMEEENGGEHDLVSGKCSA